MGININVGLLQGMTDNEMREWTFSRYGIIVTTKQIRKVSNMLNIRRSLKKFEMVGFIQ